MSATSNLRAKLAMNSWSGHGEGGTLASVSIVGWKPQDTYNSTPRDIELCKYIVEYVNRALAQFEDVKATPSL